MDVSKVRTVDLFYMTMRCTNIDCVEYECVLLLQLYSLSTYAQWIMKLLHFLFNYSNIVFNMRCELVGNKLLVL